ncbi:hypothetical protein [Marinicella rhabdoformis]|uniref:hypothetical protein n=1 Tax=Marinicella rhabdoformis TaxID=2580566 RepID=UPI0012AEB229|nr:hypothetical protein [Marinicella rhabdoformis]
MVKSVFCCKIAALLLELSSAACAGTIIVDGTADCDVCAFEYTDVIFKDGFE